MAAASLNHVRGATAPQPPEPFRCDTGRRTAGSLGLPRGDWTSHRRRVLERQAAELRADRLRPPRGGPARVCASWTPPAAARPRAAATSRAPWACRARRPDTGDRPAPVRTRLHRDRARGGCDEDERLGRVRRSRACAPPEAATSPGVPPAGAPPAGAAGLTSRDRPGRRSVSHTVRCPPSAWRSGRRPAPLALEPRQGPLSRGRVHQGPGDRLLHARRARRCCRTCATGR